MRTLSVTIDGETFEIVLSPVDSRSDSRQVEVNGQKVRVVVPPLAFSEEPIECLILDNTPYEVEFDRQLQWIKDCKGLHKVSVRETVSWNSPRSNQNGLVKAPIPGEITQVLVLAGQHVTAGQTLVLLEAMKMQNEICAAHSGVVHTVLVTPGQMVGRGEKLVEIDRRL